MTQHEASKRGVHYRCGGKLQVAEQRKAETAVWFVRVRCAHCGKAVVTRGPYQRWFQGDEARRDRYRQAMHDFN